MADSRTPDQHLATLLALAEINEKTAAYLTRPGVQHPAHRLAAQCAERAAAIRWILAETSYPIDEDTPR